MCSSPFVPRARTTIVVLPPPELELLLEDELLLDELLDDELELDDELLDDVPLPLQVGSTKLPSCVPWKPKLVLWPSPRLPFHEMLLAVTVLPDVDRLAFQLPVTLGASLKSSWICQLLIEPGPSLVTVTFN